MDKGGKNPCFFRRSWTCTVSSVACSHSKVTCLWIYTEKVGVVFSWLNVDFFFSREKLSDWLNKHDVWNKISCILFTGAATCYVILQRLDWKGCCYGCDGLLPCAAIWSASASLGVEDKTPHKLLFKSQTLTFQNVSMHHSYKRQLSDIQYHF